MKKTLFIYIFSLFIFLCVFCIASFADDAKDMAEKRAMEIEKAIFMASGAQDRVLRIALLDCIVYALKNNSEILIKRIDPKMKEADVRIAKADFEPTFTADYNVLSSAEKSTSIFAAGTSETRDIDFDAGVSGKLATGTEYEADFTNQRFTSNLSSQSQRLTYTSQPKITITQPLFKGFGVFVNTADIKIAVNNRLQSEESYNGIVMDTVTNTKTAYYNYKFYLENYKITKLSLERAQDLLNINKQRYEKGLISSVDLLETEATVAQRQKTLLSAESSIKKAEDELKLVTNLVDDAELWNAKIELLDELPFIEEKTDLLRSLQDAFLYRPDYKSAKIDMQSRDIKIKVAKNELLPTIDLVGSFGLNGVGKDYQQELSKLSTRYKDWSAGVKFTLPWGGAERAGLDQKKLEKAQALLSFKRLEQNIILDVRDKVRDAQIQQQQVYAAKLAKDKEGQHYQAQEARYAAGEVSTHDLLDYQDALSQAELDYLTSLVDYNNALNALDRAQGLTLIKNNITLEE